MKRRTFAFAALALLSAATFAAPGGAPIRVSDAWVRATVEGQKDTVAYLAIHSDDAVALVGARADVAGQASIHEMRMHGDMMMMMPVQRLDIAAGQTLRLEEGKYHLMLEQLKRPVKAGDKIVLTLTFTNAQGAQRDVKVEATARALAEHEMHEDHMHGGMGHE